MNDQRLPTIKELESIRADQVPDIIKEVEDAYELIPFDNSNFQTENFVIASSITPARAYRSIGLRMSAKLRALNEAKYARLREDIEIEELQEKINNPATNNFDCRRAELDIEQKLENRRFTDKLAQDALAELSVLYHHFKQLPKYTREQFEQEEQTHFHQRLTRQIQGAHGAHESLINTQGDMPTLLEFEKQYQTQLLLTGNQEEALLALTHKGEQK